MSDPDTSRSRKRPLEILVVSHYFAAHGGGIEKIAEKWIAEIGRRAPFHFTWIASEEAVLPNLPGQAVLPMRSWNFLEKALGLPWPIWSWRGFKRLYEAVQKSDIIWLHDTLYLGNIAAFLMAKRAKKPVIITQHIAPIPYRNPVFRFIMGIMDRLIAQPMLKAARQTVFISDRVAEEYYHEVAFQRPITIIPNGVDLRMFHRPLAEKRAWLREQFSLREEQAVLLFVGRLVDRKGLDVVKRLAKAMPELRFWIAGRGPVHPEKWMLPNVHVFRDRAGATLAELYQAADLFILPSYGEGFPLVIQEALACGLPVMCSPDTASGSRIAEGYLVRAEVWPKDPARTATLWAESLKKLPLPFREPQAVLSDLAEDAWNWGPLAEAYIKVFQEVGREVS